MYISKNRYISHLRQGQSMKINKLVMMTIQFLKQFT